MALQESVTIRNCKLDAEEFGNINAQGNTTATFGPWVNNTSYTAGVSFVTNDTAPIKVYLCITTGTSGAAGAGPTGTPTNFTDNTAHWAYIGNVGVGNGAVVGLWTGAVPATCATANSGSLIATIPLPAIAAGAGYFAAASAGAKAKAGTWSNTSAGGTGTIGYFRIYDSSGVCHYQGTCTNTGGGGDMTFDNTVVNAGQSITVQTFTITAGNA